MQKCFVESCDNLPAFTCDCSELAVLICNEHLPDHISTDSENPHITRSLLKSLSKTELLNELSELYQEALKEHHLEMREKQAPLVKLLENISQEYAEKFETLYALYNEAKDTINNISEVERLQGNILEEMDFFRSYKSKRIREIIQESEMLRNQYKNNQCEEVLTRELSNFDRKDSAEILNELGLTYIDMKKYESALLSFEESLSIHKENSSDDLNIAKVMNNIGIAYYKLNRIQDSISISYDAAAIVKKKLGYLHPHVAQSLHNIGYCYIKNKRFDEGCSHYMEALDIIKATGNQFSKQAAATLSNIGAIHYLKEDFDKALTHFQEALAIRNNTLDPDHPDIAQNLFHIGCIHYKYGSFQDALDYFTKSLRINQLYYSQQSDIIKENIRWVQFAQKKI